VTSVPRRSSLVSELPKDQVPPTRWSHAFLDRMRLVADPEVDHLARALFAAEGPSGLIRMTRALEDWEAPIPDTLPAAMREWFAAPVAYPAFVDPAKIRVAERLFIAYGPVSSVALLMCAVPHFFTNPAGARAFYLAKIFSPESLRNRLLEITQFITSFTQYGGLAQFWLAPAQRDATANPSGVRKGPGITTVQKLRMIHAGIRVMLALPREPDRRWNTDRCGQPINQEDLCEAILCFCFCTIDALAKLGIEQTPAEQDATLCAWKTVGHLLGLSEDLQPVDVSEARALHKVLFERSCMETRESKVLIQELIHIMQGIVPWGLRRVPPTLMRYLMGRRVADQLEVPRLGVLGGVLVGTRWLWRDRQVFFRLARLISPSLVHWMASREASRGHPLLADALASELGSHRT
jgi:hypothetical protein